MLALAFLVPLTTGTFDLSIGATMALSLVIVNKMALETDLPDGVGAVVGMLACLVIGAINGFIVVKLRVNSFIATLGMSQVIAALIRRIHDGGNITSAFGDSYINFGKSSLFSFTWPGSETQIELPYYFFYGLIVADGHLVRPRAHAGRSQDVRHRRQPRGCSTVGREDRSTGVGFADRLGRASPGSPD